VPTKAAYLAFEEDPSLEFEFYLAEKVFHCTVAELRVRLDQSEFGQWGVYVGRKAQRDEMAMLKSKR
jgi:hypothetical protein